MASSADVENALKALLVAAIYPSGTSAPSAMLMGATPLPAAIMRGWPHKEELKADMAAGRTLISIWPRPGERQTTRYSREWMQLASPAPTLAVAVDADAGTITLSGTVSSPQNVAAIVNGVGVVYPVQVGDTRAQVATGLAALIENVTASSAGDVITVEDAYALEARVGGFATMIRELKRQERQYQLTIWSPDPDRRDAAVAFVDGVMAGRGLDRAREFITLSDGYAARLMPAGSMPNDDAQTEGVFRHDLFFSIDYATTETTSAATTIIGDVIITQ